MSSADVFFPGISSRINPSLKGSDLSVIEKNYPQFGAKAVVSAWIRCVQKSGVACALALRGGTER